MCKTRERHMWLRQAHKKAQGPVGPCARRTDAEYADQRSGSWQSYMLRVEGLGGLLNSVQRLRPQPRYSPAPISSSGSQIRLPANRPGRFATATMIPMANSGTAG